MSLRRALRASAVVAVLTVVAVACGGTAPTADRTPTTAAATTTTPSGRTGVAAITITTRSPTLGALTFDGLAAGDPAAARHGGLVLFLHGFPETAESYRDLLPVVAAAGYYAVAIDQRGYSPAARPEAVDAYGIVELVGDVSRVVDALGAPTFHLVGHDWGGAVAWVSAVLMHDRISGLTVLSTPHPDALSDGIADPSNPQHRASAYMSSLAAPGSEDRLLEHGKDTFTAVFGPDPNEPFADLRGIGGLPAAEAERFADLLGTRDALRSALNWYRANPLPLAVSLGPVRVPTVYLWGADDATFVRSSAEATASHVEGSYTFRELPGTGHWLPETAGDEVAHAVLRQLATEHPTPSR